MWRRIRYSVSARCVATLALISEERRPLSAWPRPRRSPGAHRAFLNATQTQRTQAEAKLCCYRPLRHKRSQHTLRQKLRCQKRFRTSGANAGGGKTVLPRPVVPNRIALQSASERNSKGWWSRRRREEDELDVRENRGFLAMQSLSHAAAFLLRSAPLLLLSHSVIGSLKASL